MSVVPINPALLSPGVAAIPVAPAPTAPTSAGAAATPTAPAGQIFSELLTEQAEGPRFSKHALERLTQRGIALTGPLIARLTAGIERAAGKGARNSVVFVDGTAFVTSVQNNTVITAVTPEHMHSHVFTNIDSAVIA